MRTLLSALVLVGSAAMLLTAQEPARPDAATPKVALAPARAPSAMSVETQGDNRREAPAASSPGRTASGAKSPQAPLIGFIDSPSATCYQPDPHRDVCFINWYYLSVSASPDYIINLWVFLNPNLIAQTNGFFQTSAYIPYNQLGQGFRVACGPPVQMDAPWDSTGTTKYFVGNYYAYTIRARDSAGLAAANYGTAICPPFIP